MKRILVADHLHAEGIRILKEDLSVRLDVLTDLSPLELRKSIHLYHALIVRSKTKVTAEVIEAGRKLEVIGRAGIGLDNIDVNAATRAGIHVINSPTAATYSVAEHTIGMILFLARKMPHGHISIKNKKWEKESLMGVELRGKTLGIIGVGRIGVEVAKRARAFDMEILGYDPQREANFGEAYGIKMTDLEYLLGHSDFITLHVPKYDDTIGLIGGRELMLCRPGTRWINTSRGGIINEKELVAAIRSGHIAGAALDVFEDEPFVSPELIELEEIVFTPHVGAHTVEAQMAVATNVASEVLAYLHSKHTSFYPKSA